MGSSTGGVAIDAMCVCVYDAACCTVLRYTAIRGNVCNRRNEVWCLVLQCLVLPCIAVRCIAVSCSALYCLVLQCHVLPCLAVRCIAVSCSALQRVAARETACNPRNVCVSVCLFCCCSNQASQSQSSSYVYAYMGVCVSCVSSVCIVNLRVCRTL